MVEPGKNGRDTDVLSSHLIRVVVLLATGLAAVADAHTPLKRLQDQDRTLYVAPRMYFGDLEYLPPQGPRTNVTAAYGLYGSLRLPLKPVLPSVFIFGDIDFLSGPEHEGLDWIAAQYEYGAGWQFLPDWAVKFTVSHHALDRPLKTHELGGPDYVIWNAPSIEYTPTFRCPWSTVRADLEFYLFPPHNEYDPNPGTLFTNRPVARYAADASLLFDEICDTRFYAAARAFLPLGDSRPQNNNWRADTIALFTQTRLGYHLTDATSIYLDYTDVLDLGGLTNHRELQNTLSLSLATAF